MKLLIYFPIVLLLISCNRSINKKNVIIFHDLDNATWIGDAKVQPDADSLFYEDDPAPLFRKEFPADKDIKSAILFITAAGYYSASLNGEKIGKNYVDPAWTNYSKRIYYTEYDITDNVKEGINCLAVTLGNGFYNPLPMKMWGTYNLRDALPVGRPVFIAKLKLKYVNGKTEEFYSDDTWKYNYGPIIKNNIYIGEFYDARREISGWNKPGFDDTQWNRAKKQEGPGGKLQKIFFPPIQVTDTIIPVNVYSPRKGVYIIDMGVNYTGLYKIKLKGNTGDTILFRFGERLYENGVLNPMTTVAGQLKREGLGGDGAPPLAYQADNYIFGNSKEVWYTPEFTFHICRYIEISGLEKEPAITDIEGIAFNSNVEDNNSFSCSSRLIDSIQQAAKRTFLDNLISVQSDCPGRERFGYGGDLNAICESFMYNFDMQAFYRKTVYDWVDALSDTVFIDTAPYVGIKNCGLSYESAFLITQYKLLLFYNDIDLVKEMYDLDLKWMEKVARLHPSGIVDKGLSDHESLVKVPIQLIGTTLYLDCAKIMTRFATLMHDGKNEKKFEKLAISLSESVLNMYWRKSVPDPINRQTLFSTLLYYNVIPENEISAATDSLLKALASGPAGHFTTGIFGTKYILETLSSTGNTETVFNIVNSTAFPGWGFMIDRGATTIWETWKESDNVYSSCHPMFGSVSEWLYGWLGGIRPNPDFPGFEKFIIAPSIPSGLDYIKCVYHSPFGKIVSNWERKGIDNEFYEIKIPEGSIASVILPVNEKQKISIRKKSGNSSYTSDRNGTNYSKFELTSGEYSISVMPRE